MSENGDVGWPWVRWLAWLGGGGEDGGERVT